MELVSRLLLPFRDFLFSTSCFHCNDHLSEHEERLCSKCLNTLRSVSTNDATMMLMHERFSKIPEYTAFIPLYYFEHDGVLQTCMHYLKYNEMRILGEYFGHLLGMKLLEHGIRCDCIIPVPLNPVKQRERGFNQSYYIARGIHKMLPAKILTDAVCRIKNTVTQTHLNAEERQANMKDAFLVSRREDVSGKRILIVDDVVTTGATLSSLMQVISEAGAVEIYIGSIGLAMLDEK